MAFLYDPRDMERVMQAKKREILKELEDAKCRILKELSGVDKITLTRLREILADYNRIEFQITQRIDLIEKSMSVTVTEKINELNATLEETKKLVEELESISNFENVLIETTEKVNTLEGEVNATKESVDTINERMTTIETNVENLPNAEELAEINAQVEALRENMENVPELDTINNITTRVTANETAIDELKNGKANASTVSTLSGKVNTNTANIEALTSDFANISTELEEKANVSAIEEINTALESKVDSASNSSFESNVDWSTGSKIERKYLLDEVGNKIARIRTASTKMNVLFDVGAFFGALSGGFKTSDFKPYMGTTYPSTMANEKPLVKYDNDTITITFAEKGVKKGCLLSALPINVKDLKYFTFNTDTSNMATGSSFMFFITESEEGELDLSNNCSQIVTDLTAYMTSLSINGGNAGENKEVYLGIAVMVNNADNEPPVLTLNFIESK